MLHVGAHFCRVLNEVYNEVYNEVIIVETKPSLINIFFVTVMDLLLVVFHKPSEHLECPRFTLTV